MRGSAECWARRGLGAWLVGALLVSGLALVTAAAPVTAATGGPAGTVACDAWVSGAGSDTSGTGAKTAPYKSIEHALAVPQAPANGLWTVCLPAGTTVAPSSGEASVRRSTTVLAADPAGGSAPQFVGRLTVYGNDVTIRGLAVSRNVRFGTTVRVWGDRVSLIDSTVSSAQGTCVEVGYLDAEATPVDAPGDQAGYKKVVDVVIQDNDIGPCARSNAFLSTWTCNYSGLPGIYSQWVERLDVVGNVIHDTALRGIQLYPKNDQVLVKDNLLRHNSIGVNVGTYADDLEVRKTHQATNVTIESNVFAQQTSADLAQEYDNLRGPEVAPAGGTCEDTRAGREDTNMYLKGNPPGMTVDDEATENKVNNVPTTVPSVTIRDNCGENVRKNEAASLFTWTGNVNSPATFEAGSDQLVAGTSCVGHGPDRIQPTGSAPSPFEVMPSVPTVATIGELVRHEFLVTNFGATTRTVTLTPAMTTAGLSPALAAYRRIEGTGCNQTSCKVELEPDGHTRVAVVYAAARGQDAKLRTTLTASSSGVRDESDDTETTVKGVFCTAPYGTPAADKLTAPPAFNGTILCGFEGDDTLVPGKGGDQLRGGDGTDTAAYDQASPGGTNRWRIDLAAGTAARIPADSIDADQLISIESANGSANDDVLIGSAGANKLVGGGGVDIINAGAGNDTVDGGSGNDNLNGGADNDKITGGLGIDTVSYGGTAGAVTVRLALTTAQNTVGAGVDTLATVENAIGGNAGDRLIGTDTSNTLSGGLGNDTLFGAGGSDVLLGGAGNDTFNGGTGSDRCDQSTGTGTKTYCET
jgi:hypothetical protein